MQDITISRNRNKNFIITLLLVAIFLALTTLIDMLHIIKNNFAREIFYIVLASLICFIVLRYFVREYIYSFEKKNFVIKRKTGKRIKTDFVIDYYDIKAIGRIKSKEIAEYKVDYRYNATLKMFQKNPYVIIYKDSGKMKRVKIEMTEELKKQLIKKSGDRFHE